MWLKLATEGRTKKLYTTCTLVGLKESLYMKTAAHVTKCAKVAREVSPDWILPGNHEASSASGQSSLLLVSKGSTSSRYDITKYSALVSIHQQLNYHFCRMDLQFHLVLFPSSFIGIAITAVSKEQEGIQ